MPSRTTPVETTRLFRPEDLEDVSKTGRLAGSDLGALRAVADWIKTFVARPHKDLGRYGFVCPFVPEALQHMTLWLAAEHTVDRSADDVTEVVNGYRRLFPRTQPVDGDGLDYKSIVVVFTDLPAGRAKDFFDGLLAQLAVPAYVDDGLVLGGFYESNEVTAIYNPSFRPFRPPVPFLLIRHGVIGDWKFFLDDEDWLNLWTRRYGASGVLALAEEVRRLRWRSTG
jgi:hypothetical protein